MKKLLAFVAVLFVAVSAHAQFGIVGGFTTTSASVESAVADIGNVSQYHVGFAYKFNLGAFAIQPSVIYDVKGLKLAGFEDISDLRNASVDFKTGFVEVPVQFQLGANFGDAFRVFVLAEPYAGYAVSNNVKFEFGSEKDIQKTWDNIRSRLEYGVGLGAGFEIMKSIQVSLRYSWGLGDVYESDVDMNFMIEDAWKEFQHTLGDNRFRSIKASLAFFF